MKREEIETAIKNGERVWVANKYCIPYEVNLTNNHYIDIADNKESLMLAHIDDVELIDYLEYVFETKEKAQHYHYHANITRTETLPFLTWEEFSKINIKDIEFTDKKLNLYNLSGFGKIKLYRNIDTADETLLLELEATEQNFYKAYDECVRLFKGEE